MPLYTFQNEETKEYKDFFYKMEEVPSVGQIIIDDGIKWKRVFTVPNASINSTNIDPNSPKDFNRRLEGKNYTWGEMWDASKEMSEARASKNGGVDPVKEKYYDEYSKKRNGKEHPDKLKEKSQKQIEEIKKTTGVEVKLN